MERPLARPNAVGVAGIGDETGPAALQRNACVRCDHGRAEGVIEGIDERYREALAVHDAQVDRVGFRQWRQSVRIGHRFAFRYEAGEPFRVRLAQHLLDRYVHEVAVRHVAVAIHPRQAHGLDFQMNTLCAVGRMPFEIEMPQHVEGDKGGYPMSVRRQFDDVVSSEACRERLNPVRLRPRKIVKRQKSALGLEMAYDVVGDFSEVEAVPPMPGNDAQRFRQGRITHHLSRRGSSVAAQQMHPSTFAQVQPVGFAGPVRCHSRRDRGSVFRDADCRLQGLGQRNGPKTFQEFAPPVDGAGNRDRVDAVCIDAIDPRVSEPALIRSHGRPPRSIQAGDRPIRLPDEREAIASDPGHVGFGDAQDRRRRDRCVDCVPASPQHPDCLKCCEWRGCRRRAVQRMDGGSARQLEITHCFVLCCARVGRQ